MAALGFQFNANEVPQEERELLPAGNYMVLIENSELVQTKSGSGTMLKLVLNVLDGPYQNRKIFWNINIVNQNDLAQQIGQRQLAQLCHAIGKVTIQDSGELHLIPFIARIAVRQDKSGQYQDQNEVKEAKPVSGAQTPAASTLPAAQRPAPQPPRAQAPAAAAPVPPRPAANTAKPAWVK